MEFACKETEKRWKGKRARIPTAIQRRAIHKLAMINAAIDVNDLRTPPGNRLEPLSGDRQGQYSVRINEQWRICFCFDLGMATEIEIVDYH